MLHASAQPHMLWSEAAHHAVWLKNHTLAGNTYKAAYRSKPDLQGLQEWGSCCWVRNESVVKLGG